MIVFARMQDLGAYPWPQRQQLQEQNSVSSLMLAFAMLATLGWA